MPPEVCPNCGASVPRNAKACPQCGSDDQTGWSEDAYAGSLDLPEEEFDYEEFTKREFGNSPVPRGLRWGWWVVAIALLVAFILWVL